MPQKLNKAGQMQDYIPAGNGDVSGEYGTSNGTNKNFTTSDKKSKANVITENKSVVVENKGKTNSIEELKKQKDLAEKEMDKYVDYASKSWMPEYQDEEKRAKYYEAQRKYNELRNEINKLEDKENAKNNNGLTEKVKGGADGNTILESTIKYSKMNLSDKEIVDKVVDELGIKEEKAKEYLETIKESRKQTRANIIDNDLSGKKDNYNKALDDLKQWEIKENDNGEERIKKVKEQENYIKNSDFVNSDTKLSKDYEFKSLKNIDDVNKMYDLIKETGINPKSIYEKGKYPNTEMLVKEKLTKMYIDGKIKIDTTNNSKIPTYSGRLTKKQFADYVVGTLMENMRYRISQNKYKD